ncbi:MULTISPECIES: O-methyltransferase [Streptomyces]|uniref:O-methyltransferase n=1 Tax=Streptomyces TaxID=1883 RepID=UPI0004C4E71C|nr:MULTISPECIES: class I SAM-dependent methyltransferase [Streptomyces]MBQ1116463.1 class I SAM-dependent methyltransferase [Streptomyces sp. C3-3]
MKPDPKTVHLSPELYQYLLDHSTGHDPLLADLAADTHAAAADHAHMMIPAEQASLLTLLVRLTGARNVVEVGTFTGASGIALARGLPEDGHLITCDISMEWTHLARSFFQRAGLAERIDIRIGPALETLRNLPGEPHIDMAFIDADKPGYIDYWEQLVPRMRPGGLLVIDNTLFSGDVLNPTPGSKASAVHAFNQYALADQRTQVLMLPLSDGLTLARRLPAPR